ncbi:MAG: IS3 family transposase [Sarcina sp.]
MITKTSKFITIDELKNQYSISLLCNLAGVSRSGYYKWKLTNQKIIMDKVQSLIKTIYENSKKVYGYRRITIALKREYDLNINHNKVLRIMRELGIQSLIRRKKFKYISPKNIIQAKAVDNILNKDFSTTTINQKWVTDITYLYFGQSRNKAYLLALMDLHTKEIISYKLSTSLSLEFVEETIKDACSVENKAWKTN